MRRPLVLITRSFLSVVKGAYERAQKEANDFAASSDEELALEMKKLDEAERDIVEEADREREEILAGERYFA